MNDEIEELAQDVDDGVPTESSSRARTDLRLIGLIFLLPLLLMCVTSVVCIAVVFARH